MTLAFLISLCLFCGASNGAPIAGVRPGETRSLELGQAASQQDAAPADAANQSAPVDNNSAQNSPAAGQTSSPAADDTGKTPQSSQPTSKKTAAAKRRLRHKQPPTDAGCSLNSSPSGNAARQSSPNGTAATPSSRGDANAASPAGGEKTPSKCPPAKVIVRDGGTSEPSVQLTGDAATGPASPQAARTDQLMGSTEENLKKLTGRQLSASQQDMVTQIRQYMEQAKAAIASGDTERGRSLALKANLLSQDLTKQ